MFKKYIRVFSLLLLPVGMLIAFSIITSSEGYYRKYRLSDIPFVYKIHTSASVEWQQTIDAGAQVWEDVPSAYFEFQNGGTTTANSVALDNINLVYFDSNYDNFTQGSNVIAFSSTFTSGSGSSFHAVESDLIWNAGDFPPGINGEPNLIDMQSTIAHEFGHHLGLGHTGRAVGSNQPGAGDVIPDATMYYAVAPGDTTPRSLHIDDKMGVSGIYPRWKLKGTVTDSATGAPVPQAFFSLDSTLVGAIIGPPENVHGTQRGGWVIQDSVLVDPVTADYSVIPQKSAFTITFDAFGYLAKDTAITFTDLQSVNDVITWNPRLVPTQRNNLVIQIIGCSRQWNPGKPGKPGKPNTIWILKQDAY